MFDFLGGIVFGAAMAAHEVTDRIVKATGSTTEEPDIAKVVIREGMNRDGRVILTSCDIVSVRAAAMRQPACDYDWAVVFELNERGSADFCEATTRIAQKKGIFSVWVDGKRICAMSVYKPVTTGRCVVSGKFRTFEDAKALVDSINETSEQKT